MIKRLFLLAVAGIFSVSIAQAQRYTDKLDRGVVAVPSNSGGYLVSWRMFGEEYYDTKYNLYRDGTKVAGNLTKSSFVDENGSSSAKYSVEAVVKGVSQGKSVAVQAWDHQYKAIDVPPVIGRDGSDVTVNYHLNDISLADVTGDGIAEFLIKRPSSIASGADETNCFHHYECITMNGERLWWIDLGPNMLSGPDEQWDMIAYDWDRDGKAEALLIGADNMIIHTATGKTINVGDMSYVAPRSEYTCYGKEYLLYLNGETGEPYLGWDGSDKWTPMLYPLPRFETGEASDVYNQTSAEYKAVWGDNDTGHRSRKHYMGAPYLDGRNPSIFLGRGAYTRHKFCALDVNPATHELTQRWRWNCYDSKSPWFGNGFHNFQIADVDMDGRDEIMFGSMCIDDTGYGLSTTGLGHGDAQHCGDLDPYRWGLEQFTCQEGSQGNSYWNPTTGNLYYRKSDGGDDGRSMAGNFTNDYPGGQGRSVSSGIIGLSSDKVIVTDGDSKLAWGDLNMRIYWDGDLCDELLNSPGVGRVLKISKWGNGRILTSPTGQLNNSSKNNPCVQGDILGDWREEVVVRQGEQLHIYTTNYPTNYGIYTLWHDHEYRNAMTWQCVGYNQPPHPSFFLGELEGITIAPPPLMLRGRTEVENGGTITTADDHLLISGYDDKTISVIDGASPYILTVNAPAWVQGSGAQQAVASTPKAPARTIINYTTTLTGGAFSGATRLVKQGEGTLVLPNVVEKHTGNTDIWNGTLVFDGTMEKSPVWLNRHTTLISEGGKFMGGLKADYNATIYPGGVEKTGSLTASTLTLGFGSRVVFDVVGTAIDQLNASKIVVDARDWSFGPKYKTPVFEFVGNVNDLPSGTYELGSVAVVSGSLNDILIEGIANKRFLLQLNEGKLYLILEDMREATVVTWNGTTSSNVWDLAETKNFLNSDGEAAYAAQGDDILFDDTAASGTVNVKGAVRPNSITFNNSKRIYTLKGDSILGGAPIVKNGTAQVTINNENRVGPTTVNGGKLIVNALANLSGITYGALGDVNQRVTLNDGSTFQISAPIITDQPFYVDGSVTINIPTSQSLTFNKGLKGNGASVTKTGAGSMTLGVNNTFSNLVIKQGVVNAIASGYVDQLPSNVEFQGGTLWAANDESNNINDRANFIVPSGKTGTLYAGFRSTYTGTLTGTGTFSVYTGGIRCYFDGDWSEFTGTIKALKENRQNKKQYDPIWAFRNTNGLPNATLNVASGVRVSNEGKDIELGRLTGSGTLTGSGKWILGSNGNDFTLSTEIGVTYTRTDPYGNTISMSKSPVVKRGAGKMIVASIGNIYGDMTIEDGTVAFYDKNVSTLVFGSTTTTVKDRGRLVGQGVFNVLYADSGAVVMPCGSYSNETTPGTLKTNALMRVASGATIVFLIGKESQSTITPRALTMNGTVKVQFLDGYEPTVDDEFTLWTVSSTYNKSVPKFDLPVLPDGLYWDVTDVNQKTGVLRIISDPTGIGRIAGSAEVECEVYTLSGTKVASFASTKAGAADEARRQGLLTGTYIVKLRDGWRSEALKVIVR